MASYRARSIAVAVTFVRMMMVFTHDQALLFGVDNANTVAASLLGHSLYVGTVRRFTGSLFSRLGNVGCTFGQILPVLLLLVNDLFVVRYISWIGHDSR